MAGQVNGGRELGVVELEAAVPQRAGQVVDPLGKPFAHGADPGPQDVVDGRVGELSYLVEHRPYLVEAA